MIRAILMAVLLTSTGVQLASAESSEEIAGRIDRVLNGLRPSTAFDGTFDEPASLQQRMEHYNTPGVSIAVVNEGRIEWATRLRRARGWQGPTCY